MARNTVVAIMYDFDKTLTTQDMQEYTFIPKLGMSNSEFWLRAATLAKKERMDNILAYMKLMLDESRAKNQPIHRIDLVKLGRDLQFFPGVRTWFEDINRKGGEMGITLEHYIISSGLKEVIEGSLIGKEFKEIYASEYLYENNVASWPKLAVNYTAKTQFLFRINKGVLDVYEDKELNAFTPESNRPIPFRNMIYIGDGLTDVPCMKLVKANGGKSIAVHKKDDLQVCKKLMKDNRIDFFTEANYLKDGQLFSLVTTILTKMKADDELAMMHGNMLRQANEEETEKESTNLTKGHQD
ncbi:MAG: HAD family hydrolase [Sphaerochaetaceae bacterium]